MDVDQNTESIPLCTTCGHNHIQGTKCSICGHVGRSQILPKMKMRANEGRKIKILSYKGETMQNDIWEVIKEMRGLIYCLEFGVTSDNEFNEAKEIGSTHVLGLAGNAPIFIARYQIRPLNLSSSSSSSSSIAIDIDKLGVLPNYRGRSLSKMCLKYILNEIQHLTQSTIISQVGFTIHNNPAIVQKLVHLGFTINTISEFLSSTTEQNQTISLATYTGDIITFSQNLGI